jgi:DUF4097 and DUF4098 domain-containing protein YvlB
MNSRSASFGLALLAAAVGSGTAPAEDYTKSYSIANRAVVHVDTNDGSVRVVTGDNKQVEFHVEYQGYTLDKTLHIETHQQGDAVDITARAVNFVSLSFGTKRTLHIEVRMPKDADLKIVTGDGSVEAGSLAGDVSIRTGDGQITLSSVKGNVRLHTGDGAIAGNDLDGKFDAVSGDGRVRLTGRFDALNIKTGDGSIEASALPGSKLDSGWSIATSDGSVDVALPGDLKAAIDASTADGHITSDIPITIEGSASKSRISGKMNGGGPPLTIHSGDGSIHLKQS